MVQLVEHMPSKLVDWARVELYRRLNDTCGLSSLVLGVDGLEQGKGLRAVLPLTRYQCNIHCGSSRMAYGSSKGNGRRRPLATRPVSKGGLRKFFATLEKCVGHSLKILDIVQKIWAPLEKLFAPPGVANWLWAYSQRSERSTKPSINETRTSLYCCVTTMQHSKHVHRLRNGHFLSNVITKDLAIT